ncbi:MAG: NifB/NifX family molybdenum-iron cluster-binding protein [Candidatus Aceula meridiana]|nr:NifB/NifX family molybdenum-iron cluster-binding protein [Candidatus Aceula meridiana]
MKVCVTAQGDNLQALVDPRFGRAKYFLAVDVDSLDFEVIENVNAQGTGGVGIQSGRLMADKGVECVLTGNIGPNASDTLKAAGIKFCLGATGTVLEAVEKYKKGEMTLSEGSNVDSKSGA